MRTRCLSSGFPFGLQAERGASRTLGVLGDPDRMKVLLPTRRLREGADVIGEPASWALWPSPVIRDGLRPPVRLPASACAALLAWAGPGNVPVGLPM